MSKRYLGLVIVLGACLGLAGCYAWHASEGGGQTKFTPPRKIVPADVVLPPGYRIEAVATGLTFPTGVTFDEQGRVYVVEAGYSYGEAWTTPRLLRIEPGGQVSVIATGDDPPWNGVVYYQGAFYVAEGGEAKGGRISRVGMDGKITPLIENLPSLGDHHTNGPAIGPDGWIYFGQGTATNSGVVGLDDARFGWLKRHPDFHDIPAKDIKLTGQNFTTSNPLSQDAKEKVATGAYSAFGTPTQPGQVIPGRLPCTGAIMRIPLNGGPPQLVAWGLRNPFGLAFSPEGRLYITENSFDVRGSRPIWGTGDCLWAIEPGTWYGWPDYFAGLPLEHPYRFKAPGEEPPKFLLAEHPQKPPRPVAIMAVHASACGLDFPRSGGFGHVGRAFVAQFGDMAPSVGKVEAPVGYKVVMVDVASGVIQDFAANRGKMNGPASDIGGGGFERPVAVRFDPTGKSLYVVDFGVMTLGKEGTKPWEKTGVLWRITREGSQ